jgi:hypothetical protein
MENGKCKMENSPTSLGISGKVEIVSGGGEQG